MTKDGGISGVFSSAEYWKAFASSRALGSNILNRWLVLLLDCLASQNVSNPLVVDLGCGMGRFTYPLSRRIQHHFGKVIGIDSSDVAIRLALESRYRRPSRNVQIQKADVCSFELPRACDLFFASEILQVIASPNALFAQCANQSHNRTSFVARVPAKEWLTELEWLKFFPTALKNDLNRNSGHKQIVSELSQQGFKKAKRCYLVDERRKVPATDIITAIEHRAFSILKSIDDSEFHEGLRDAKRYFGQNDFGTLGHKMWFIARSIG